jgi:hypothetical protein
VYLSRGEPLTPGEASLLLDTLDDLAGVPLPDALYVTVLAERHRVGEFRATARVS